MFNFYFPPEEGIKIKENCLNSLNGRCRIWQKLLTQTDTHAISAVTIQILKENVPLELISRHNVVFFFTTLIAINTFQYTVLDLVHMKISVDF